MTLHVRLLIFLGPLLFVPLSATAPATAQSCTGSATTGFNCLRDDGNAAVGTVFSASESGARRNVSLTLIEELVEEEAAPSGGGDLADGLELFAFGGYGWHDYDTKNVLGQDGDRFSGVAGVSYRGDFFVVGLALDIGLTDADIASSGGSREEDEYGAQLFGTVFPIDNFFISGGARIAMLDIETRRNVTTSSNVARGDTDGIKYGLTGGVGYNLPIADATVVGFSGWLAWERTEVDGYTESGATAVGGGSADAPNLRFEDDNINTLDGILRVEVAHALRLDSVLIVPSARFDYVHEFQSDTRTIDASLPPDVAGDQTFISYRTNEADENYFRLGASLTAAFDQGTSITAGYSGDFGHSWREEHVVLFGLSHRF